MFTNDQIAQIRELIHDKGPQGVNSIASELNIPVSTAQKYLERQDLFKKTKNRKWDLPENIAIIEHEEVQDHLNAAISAQLDGISNLSDMLITQLNALQSLTSTYKPVKAPVAGPKAYKRDNSPQIDPQLVTIDQKLKDLVSVFKQNAKKCPDYCANLILNFDIVRYVIENGSIRLQEVVLSNLTDLFTQQTNQFTIECEKALESYQR